MRKSVACAALVVALAVLAPAGSAAALPGRGSSLRMVHFASSFEADGMVSADGAIWVLGSVGSDVAPQCDLDQIEPRTLTQRLIALPTCATDLTAGGGMLYLLDDDWEGTGSNTRLMHVTTFDPRTVCSRT